ncbi:hypothetical protein [Commensalibacter nepenthis]|uniref:Alpha/beta hydrolase n=1 Tax=Commensalibacter nepenthis TaxID=3043872 RepID=A0ABT6Q529_9PROT|nr:hypothetical protein [Commensalibacter sp. TBRC 10068]MDI2112003.1 hypothetical protein [Commensalibacter sp. TBRC 10068]
MIIYEGKELFLHHHEGNTDYIIISFLGAHETNIAKETFFLKPIVEKYNISCLGITPKVDNYYLHSDMHEIISLCNDITKNYKKIILIGQSVAGYAVIKYSKQLNADVVLALAPRATLDQEICTVTDETVKIASALTPEQVKETTIKKDDLQGEIFIVYDPLSRSHWLDKEHIGLLKEQIPHVNFIVTYFTEHLIIFHLLGSQVFKSIIDSLVSGNKQNIVQTINYVRRHHITNIESKVLLLTEKYPYLIYKMLTSQSMSKVRNNHRLFNNNTLILKLCFCLTNKGYQQESSQLLQSIFISKTGNLENFFKPNQQLRCLNPYPYLISFHGNFLVYNYNTNKVETAINLDEKPNCAPIQLYNQNGRIKLVCIHHGYLFELEYYDNMSFNLTSLTNDPIPNQIKLTFSGYMIFIHTSDKKHYIGVNANGSIHYATKPQGWESFTAIPAIYSSENTKQHSLSFNVNNHNITISIQ